MVWSSYMKFWQQFEIHKLFVCAKFKAMSPITSGFGPETTLKFCVKSGLIQKRLKYGKKYFTWLICRKILFIFTYTFSYIEFFFFFHFLLSKFCALFFS